MRFRSLPVRARLVLTVVAALSALGTPAAPALGFHGDHPTEKREIVQLEYRLRAAQLSGDVAALDRLLAEDYVGTNVTGQVNTKAQLLRRTRNHDLILSRIELKSMQIRLLGDVATVRVRAVVEGTSQGTPLSGHFAYTRIYHRLPTGVWKITYFEATRLQPHRESLAG